MHACHVATHICLHPRRPSGIPCFPSTDQYYQVMYNGLDSMMQRFLNEVHLLAGDATADQHLNSTRLNYLFKTGYYDLHDGMRHNAQLTTDTVLAQFTAVKQAHIILFVLSVMLALAFLLGMFRPFLKRWATSGWHGCVTGRVKAGAAALLLSSVLCLHHMLLAADDGTA